MGCSKEMPPIRRTQVIVPRCRAVVTQPYIAMCSGQAVLLQSAALSSWCDSVQDLKNKKNQLPWVQDKINILLKRIVKYDAEWHKPKWYINPLNAELNPICHLLALLGGATIVVVSRLRVNENKWNWAWNCVIPNRFIFLWHCLAVTNYSWPFICSVMNMSVDESGLDGKRTSVILIQWNTIQYRQPQMKVCY